MQELLKKFLVHCTNLVTHMVHRKIVLGATLYVKMSLNQDCVEGFGNHSRSKCCSYPNHKQCRMRAACGTPLLKSVELASQRKILYPFMTYCYFGLECSLQSLLLIPS